MSAAVVLFTAPKSVYGRFSGVECYDRERDARNYRGPHPVVAHPPCRAGGRLRHMAKPRHDEKELGIFAWATVRMFGGVVEHPAGSKLFELVGARPGGVDRAGGWVLPIWQSWFGHPARKSTWLYIVGCRPADVPRMPLVLGHAAGRVELQSAAHRELTPPDLAVWLLELAARCRVGVAA